MAPLLQILQRQARGHPSGLAILGLAAACSLADPALADPERDRALSLAREGRCESALPLLDAERLAAADDAELALLAGRCRLRLHRYPEAASDLARAVELAPDRGDAWLSLAKARYHAEDLPAAEAALDRAAERGEEGAELWLYRGMVALRRGKPSEAAKSLERARALDAERVEPVASYYLGIAHEQAQDVDRAGVALDRVSNLFPGTEWSARADDRLRVLRTGPARQAWLTLSAGFEYDDNVVLRGRDVSLPQDISDEADERGVWTANAGAELFKNEVATVGLMGSYRGTTHVDLHEFDAHFPSVTAWADLALAERLTGTARYDFGYAWLDGDPFLALSSWQLALARVWPELGSTRIYGRTTQDHYFFDSDDVEGPPCTPGLVCGPAGLNERSARRRSGWSLGGGIGHTLPLATGDLPITRTELRAGYDFEHFDARGREYSNNGHRFGLGLSTELPLQLGFDLDGSYAYKQYRNPSTFPDPPIPAGQPYMLSNVRRRDQVWFVGARLERPVNDLLSVSTHWRYTDNQSNTDVFDYDQHVVGFTVTLGFGREL